MTNISELRPSGEMLPEIHVPVPISRYQWRTSFWQIVRFSIVGILNTIIDILTLNILLLRFPTHNTNLLLLYNSIAYTFGALNSFALNKYWTFKHKQDITSSELFRFAFVNIIGILCNDFIIWSVASILHPFVANSLLWANMSKGCAIVCTAAVSYFGMRLWVFTNKGLSSLSPALAGKAKKESVSASSMAAYGIHKIRSELHEPEVNIKHSFSVIMPAHNEEVAIAATVRGVIEALTSWTDDFEVIVINDGSKDHTQAIVEDIVAADQHVRLINHPYNQGYGAALVSGFESITKELVFFMDSDGQFDIHDLERFFPFIEEYDAVLGYRVNRQDTWVRKLNAWGWKMLVRFVFGLRARDIDCAFKLYWANFFYEHKLETRGAMINTEILYKFTRSGYTYTQLGVRHLPRRGGKATGAKPSVIARAFREMFLYARKWHREERETIQRLQSQQRKHGR